MREDIIKKIEIDGSGRLCIWPAHSRFELIYRSAAEVHWDNESKFLYSPKPREWSYLDWFKHMTAIALDEYGVRLSVGSPTEWIGIDAEIQRAIERFQNNS